MVFDEMIEKFEQEANEYNGLVPMETVYELILDLKEEYAPTVEMTKEQYDYISQLLQESNEIGATFTEFWEVYIFTRLSKKLKPAFESQEQAMQAWLHPETIKVVDE